MVMRLTQPQIFVFPAQKLILSIAQPHLAMMLMQQHAKYLELLSQF